MACICPLCENVIPQPDKLRFVPEANLVLWPTGHVQLTEAQFLILHKIFKMYPRPISTERLAMHYYINHRSVDDPPGDDVIRVQISFIRKKLRNANAPFELPPLSGCGIGYSVRWIDKEEAA